MGWKEKTITVLCIFGFLAAYFFFMVFMSLLDKSYQQQNEPYCKQACDNLNCTSFEAGGYYDRNICRLKFCAFDGVCETRIFGVNK